MNNKKKKCNCEVTGVPCKNCTCQKRQTIENSCVIDWTDFTEKSLKHCNENIGDYEDKLIGFLPFQAKDRHYIMDIHYSYLSSREKGFCLEIYGSDEKNLHCDWLGSILSIKSATDYQRFRKRVKKALVKFLEEQSENDTEKTANKAS